MNANMQQWAGEIRYATQMIADVVLVSDSTPSDLRLLNSLLTSVRITAAAMESLIEKGGTE